MVPIAATEIRSLHNTIKKFNEITTKQAKHMIWLTRVIAVLTIVMVIVIVVQIFLAYISSTCSA